MPLTVRVSREDAGATVRVHPSGSLDSATAGALERELAPILASKVSVLVLDLAEVTFVSSAGIRVVLAARKQMADRGGALLMANLQPPVAKALQRIRGHPDVTIL